MNPHIYEEYHLGRRRFREYYAKTLGMGVVSLFLAIWFGYAHRPLTGPGIYASAGFSAAGLLIVWGLRNLHRAKLRSRWATWLKERSKQKFPVILIFSQGWFLLLTAMLIWFTIVELGFIANTLQHALLFLVLLLIPVRRILAGTDSHSISPRRELTARGLTYLNVMVITLFIASAVSNTILPEQQAGVFANEAPLGAILVWLSAVLILLTCFVLFLDHIVRKMPTSPKSEEQDTLD